MLSSPVPEGSVLAGKYRVEGVLGRGGMGVVLSAWHLELDQRVALKFLGANLSDSPDAAERFRREARAAARIRSEHVVRVLDVGVVHGTMPYMVMEYLEGNDLEEEVERRGALPVADAIDYVLQAIEAIAEAHAAGIVHRDLKPGNLFLFHRPDGTKMIKVLDFGISKSLPTSAGSANQMSLTATASLMGSPLYMSPEQMQSPRAVDTRTDIWSLGAILYHLLSGEPPYMGENIAQLCSQLMNSTPVPLSKRRADIPLELERVVARCLEKDREKRIGNVGELAEGIARFGSAGSQVHVSRATRILSSSDLDGRPPTARSDAGVLEGSGTQAAWDRDQSRRGQGRPRRWVIPGTLALVLLAAVAGVALALRGPAPLEQPVPLASGAAEAKPEVVPGPELPRALDGVPHTGAAAQATLALGTGTATPEALPSASSAPAPSARPAVLAAPRGAGWNAPRQPGPAPIAKPPSGGVAPDARQKPPAPAGDGLTDFGGRR